MNITELKDHVKKHVGKIDTEILKGKDPELYNSIKGSISSNGLIFPHKTLELPVKILKKLHDRGYINHSSCFPKELELAKNTLEGLELLSKNQLSAKTLPSSSFIPSLSVEVPVEVLKDGSLISQVPFSKVSPDGLVKLGDLPPKAVLELAKNQNIDLSGKYQKLLKGVIKAGKDLIDSNKDQRGRSIKDMISTPSEGVLKAGLQKHISNKLSKIQKIPFRDFQLPEGNNETLQKEANNYEVKSSAIIDALKSLNQKSSVSKEDLENLSVIQEQLKSLEDKNGNVKVSRLPYFLQKRIGIPIKSNQLGEDDKGLIFSKQDVLDNTDKIARQQLDQINPYSDEIEVDDLNPEILNDFAKTGLLEYQRAQKGYQSCEKTMQQFPDHLDTIDKVIEACRDKVDSKIIKPVLNNKDQYTNLGELPFEMVESLEKEGQLSIPQNFDDNVLLLNESSPKNKKRQDVRVRSNRNRSKNLLSPPKHSSNYIPLQNLMKSSPFMTEKLKSEALSKRADPSKVQLSDLPSEILSDLGKRGVIPSSVIPTDSKVDEKLRESIKKTCLYKPIQDLNKSFEIIDTKNQPIATIKDLNKYLSTKNVPKHALPVLPERLQKECDKLKSDEVPLNMLPLSVVYDMCKHNDVNIDKEAIETMNNLTSDIVKPRRRAAPDYKSLMKTIKQQQKSRSKQIALSPNSRRRMVTDRSLLHAPQNFKNSLGNSRFLLPSDTASLNLSKRFAKPSQMMHSSSQGVLNRRSGINSPSRILQSPQDDHFSSTNAESKYRFYPARIDVSSILYADNANIEARIEKTGNPEATRISAMNPNSFFRDQSSIGGHQFLSRYQSSRSKLFSPDRPSTHR
ncbi:unnamed protein product [Moneuplotes crassus]|uniref:Uncharacterized protein n=1 Tax=Euplotes crassus TaxID=5936 RepID=A0AAD2DD28_EUPCR|nr:unnamed protein product [Moneuplotes crassus]